MVSHRHEEMMCSTILILRKSETGDDQMGVVPKTGLCSHNSCLKVSAFCSPFRVDKLGNTGSSGCWLTVIACSGSF